MRTQRLTRVSQRDDPERASAEILRLSQQMYLGDRILNIEYRLSTKIFRARPHRVINPAGYHPLTDECHNAVPRLASRLIDAAQIIAAWSPGDKSVKKPGWLTKSPIDRDSSRVYRPSSLGRTGMGR